MNAFYTNGALWSCACPSKIVISHRPDTCQTRRQPYSAAFDPCLVCALCVCDSHSALIWYCVPVPQGKRVRCTECSVQCVP